VQGGDPYLTVDNKTYSCENNRMGEYAFANTNLEKFRFPAGIVTVDSTIFKGSENLNSIQFDKLPAGMTTQAAKNLFGENQKNGIIAINNTGTASNVTNLVFLNDVESEVVLVDKYNYDSDVKLSVGKCTFTKEFSKETKKGESKGWETIMLPFIPTEIRGKNLRGNEAFLVPFGSDKNAFTGKGLDLVLNFWMKKLNPDGEFVNITFDEIEANVPYLISMPNNTTDYGNTYNISGDVQFIANAAAGETVALNEKADPGILTGKYYDFSATFKAFTDVSVYVLNAAGSSFDLITGEEFNERANKVNAFEGYAVAHPQYQGVKSFRFDEAPSIPSDIEEIMMNREDENGFFIHSTSNGIRIVSNVNKAIQIHSIEGRLIANEYIYEGENFVALPKGIYLIERQKVVVY
ncbi:MAG: leucine-rich repeat protein, partial [Bacteroidales bacterium]